MVPTRCADLTRASAQRILTGLAQLDTLLDGGLPRGRSSEVSGAPTCGKLTPAAQVAARRIDAFAVWIDPSGIRGSATWRRCGVALARLVITHPETLRDGRLMAGRELQSGALVALVFDMLPGRTRARRRATNWTGGACGGVLGKRGSELPATADG